MGEGLGHDLVRLREAHSGGVTADFVLGERDFPMRLAPPARLVGRDGALAELRSLFAAAVAGDRGVALVTGAPGVGKTALIEHLRPTVTAAGGRFVTGEFDQYRRDLCIVMPGTDADGARLVAERARQAVADLCEPHTGTDIGIVTISVGLTAAVPAVGQPDQLIKVADQTLYETKRDGRNRVATG